MNSRGRHLQPTLTPHMGTLFGPMSRLRSLMHTGHAPPLQWEYTLSNSRGFVGFQRHIRLKEDGFHVPVEPHANNGKEMRLLDCDGNKKSTAD